MAMRLMNAVVIFGFVKGLLNGVLIQVKNKPKISLHISRVLKIILFFVYINKARLMTSASNGLEILLNDFSILNTVYLFASLVFGMIAALNKEFFLYALGFVVMYVLVLSKFAIFVPTMPVYFNNVLIFLAIGYCVTAVVKMACNHWHNNW